MNSIATLFINFANLFLGYVPENSKFVPHKSVSRRFLPIHLPPCMIWEKFSQGLIPLNTSHFQLTHHLN